MQAVKKKLSFAKIAKSKANKGENVEDCGVQESKVRASKKDIIPHGQPCRIELYQNAEDYCKFQRFKSSEHFYRRRNGITEKDYFEFMRLKTRRVQQQIIDTYVYGWR